MRDTCSTRTPAAHILARHSRSSQHRFRNHQKRGCSRQTSRYTTPFCNTSCIVQDLVDLAFSAAAAAVLGIRLRVGTTHARRAACSACARGTAGSGSTHRASISAVGARRAAYPVPRAAARPRSVATARAAARATRCVTTGATLRVSTRLTRASSLHSTSSPGAASRTHFGQAGETGVARASVARAALRSRLACGRVVTPLKDPLIPRAILAAS